MYCDLKAEGHRGKGYEAIQNHKIFEDKKGFLIESKYKNDIQNLLLNRLVSLPGLV